MFNKVFSKIPEKDNDKFNSDWEHSKQMESGEIASDFDKDTIKCLKNFFHLDLLCF
jgi:hypothetical protein